MRDINDFYYTECDESKRLMSQAGQVEYKTTMTYLQKYIKPEMTVLDACAGGGIYAFTLAEYGCEVTAGDLIDVNVEHIRRVNKEKNILKEIYKGSILNLSQFRTESFDAVLNLGAYYHLCDETERLKSIKESLRVLKTGGIYVMSYINRYANYMAHCDEMINDFGFFERYMESGHIDNDYVFYATTPELVENEMKNFSVKLLHNVAADGPVFIYREVVDKMKAEDFEKFMEIHMSICEKYSTLGYSEHGLLIAVKQ